MPTRAKKTVPAEAAKGTVEEVLIPPINIARMRIKIIGDSPLISHRWSDKAKKEMLDKQMKKAKQAKEAKDPWMDFCNSLYWVKPSPMPAKPTEDDVQTAIFGFPSVGFKAAAVDACSHADGVTKVLARGAFHIEGDIALRFDGH